MTTVKERTFVLFFLHVLTYLAAEEYFTTIKHNQTRYLTCPSHRTIGLNSFRVYFEHQNNHHVPYIPSTLFSRDIAYRIINCSTVTVPNYDVRTVNISYKCSDQLCLSIHRKRTIIVACSNQRAAIPLIFKVCCGPHFTNRSIFSPGLCMTPLPYMATNSSAVIFNNRNCMDRANILYKCKGNHEKSSTASSRIPTKYVLTISTKETSPTTYGTTSIDTNSDENITENRKEHSTVKVGPMVGGIISCFIPLVIASIVILRCKKTKNNDCVTTPARCEGLVNAGYGKEKRNDRGRRQENGYIELDPPKTKTGTDDNIECNTLNKYFILAPGGHNAYKNYKSEKDKITSVSEPFQENTYAENYIVCDQLGKTRHKTSDNDKQNMYSHLGTEVNIDGVYTSTHDHAVKFYRRVEDDLYDLSERYRTEDAYDTSGHTCLPMTSSIYSISK